MTKAASVSIGLVLLFTITTPAWAQRSPTAVAAEEALRRQNAVLELRSTLTDAQAAEAKGDFTLAKTLYEECYQLVQGIGAAYNIEAETALTLSGLANSHLELARAAQKRGQLREANTHVSRVLVVSPNHPAALEFKAANDKLLAEKQPYLPSPEVVDRIPQFQQEKATANTLVQDAAVLLEAGKLQEAEAKLAEARRIDPDSRAVQYYSSLVKEREYRLAEAQREQDSKKAIVDVQKDWARPAKRDTLPIPNPYARTNLIFTGKGRQTIMRKLDLIKMDSVMWDGLGLQEVVRNLSEEAKKRDPEKRGINFIVNPNAEVIPQQVAPTIDPTTGLPVVAPPPEVIDIASVSVKLNPGLTDVTLAEVLDAIVKVADKPIKYSVEDYAVVFSLKGPEPLALEIRTYKVDPNTFYQGLESVSAFAFDIQTSSGTGGGGGGGRSGGGAGGTGAESILTVPRVNVSGGSGQTGGGGGVGGGQQGGGLRFTTRTNNMEEVSIAVQNFFRTLGVNLDPALGKSVFWNDRSGVLMVRATTEELDIIDTAIQVLNVTPHQVNIKAKFVEITQEDNRALGFDWYLGNFLFGNKQIVGSGGSQPTLNGPPTVANPQGFFPGTSPGTAIPSAATDHLITGGLRNSYGLAATDIPTIATFTGILTDPQFRMVIKAIDTREGVDLLSSPEVTTVSGRQAQVQVVDLRTVVTGVQQNQGQQAGAVATGGGGNVTLPPAAIFQTPDTQLLPFGPILDVVPYISADGFTIQMTLIPSITEFVGYDDPGLFVPRAVTGTGSDTPLESVLPLPRFRLRQVTTSAVVWDGQTIVLGGLLSEDVRRLKDKVPVLGDIPLVGRFFRSESSSTFKKNLVIFVTPTIVDPAGNRLHSEDEMPFRQTTIPPQEPIR